MLNVYIGYDPNETVAYHVLSHSILRHASCPVSVTPLVRDQLPYYRNRGELESTEFSFTRFLVPYLSDFEGWSLFLDCDMLVTDDIQSLFQCADHRYAVQVVKHDYTPKTERKFLDQPQSVYARKNWSSVILFNNKRCQKLTPEIVNSSSGLYLHRFEWLPDQEIGELHVKWNYLVGEFDWWPSKNGHTPPSNIHYTLGGPWFEDSKDCEFADLWLKEKELMNG